MRHCPFPPRALLSAGQTLGQPEDGTLLLTVRPILASPRLYIIPTWIAVLPQRIITLLRLLHVVTRRPELPPLHLGPVRTASRRRRTLSFANTPADDPLKGEPEVFREQRVDQRIDRAIEVTQPEEDRKDQVGNAGFGRAERPNQVHGEEGQPAEDKTAHYDGQRLGGFRFHPETLHLRLDVPFTHAARHHLQNYYV